MTRCIFCFVWLSLLAACGGGGGGSGTGGERTPGPAPPPATNAPPSARFDLYRDGGHGPLTMSVDGGSSQDPASGALVYQWDFGDRTQASGVAASHTYTEPGSFMIALMVTDSGGASGRTAQSVTVDVEELVCVSPG